MPEPAARFDIDVSAMRRAQAVRGVVLQVFLALLILGAGLLSGLATANVATRRVVEALAEDAAAGGPIARAQHRSIEAIAAYYASGSSSFHAIVLASFACILLMLALAIRRRLLPEGVTRARLLLGLGAVAAVSVLVTVAFDPFGEIGVRAAADRNLLLAESLVWGRAIDLSYLAYGALAVATLSVGFAAVSPTRIASVALGTLGGLGYAVIVLTRLPVGPLASPEGPPPGFLDVPGGEVRVLLVGARPMVLRARLPDVGLEAGRPSVTGAAEAAATAAAGRFGRDDPRGAVARLARAVAPLARFDRLEFARRVSSLAAETGSPRTLALLRDLLGFPASRGPEADIALGTLGDPERIYLGSAVADVCRAEVARGRLGAAARIKEVARADGVPEAAAASCVVEPPAAGGSLTGSVVVDGRPTSGIAVALADEARAEALGASAPADRVELTALAGAPSTRTADDGTFRFDGIPAGSYRFLVLLDDPRLSPDARAEWPGETAVVAPGGTTPARPIPLTTRFE